MAKKPTSPSPVKGQPQIEQLLTRFNTRHPSSQNLTKTPVVMTPNSNNRATFSPAQAPVQNQKTFRRPPPIQPSEYRNLCEKLSKRVPQQHFMRITGNPEKQFQRSYRLKRQQFKKFLQDRYGAQIAEKWVFLFEFSQAVIFEYKEYCA